MRIVRIGAALTVLGVVLMITLLRRSSPAILTSPTNLALGGSLTMNPQLPLFPESASTLSPEVDALYIFLVGGQRLLLAADRRPDRLLRGEVPPALARRGRPADPRPPLRSRSPGRRSRSVITMVMFVWGAQRLLRHVPAARRRHRDLRRRQAVDVEVPAPDGQREINELHVPVGRAGEADHDLRGRDPQLLRPGVPREAGRRSRAATPASGSRRPSRARYHLFCAEYCGTQALADDRLESSSMEPADYQAWLAGGAGRRVAGRRRRRSCSAELACSTCHRGRTAGRAARRSRGCSASRCTLQSGETVVADDAYIRESILQPDGEGRRRLPADHADVPGPGQRGAAARS